MKQSTATNMAMRTGAPAREGHAERRPSGWADARGTGCRRGIPHNATAPPRRPHGASAAMALSPSMEAILPGPLSSGSSATRHWERDTVSRGANAAIEPISDEPFALARWIEWSSHCESSALCSMTLRCDAQNEHVACTLCGSGLRRQTSPHTRGRLVTGATIRLSCAS